MIRQRRRRGLLLISAPLLGCVLLVLAACSGAAPEILTIESQVLAINDTSTGTVEAGLSIFVMVRDPDGRSDLKELFIINDEAEMFWSFTDETWLALEREEELWIGHDRIVGAGGRDLPGGLFRVVLLDAAGERSEADFTAAGALVSRAQSLDARAFPALEIGAGSMVVSVPGNQESALVRVFDRGGNRVGNASVEPGRISHGEFESGRPVNRSGNRAFVYVEDGGVGLVSGPYPF